MSLLSATLPPSMFMLCLFSIAGLLSYMTAVWVVHQLYLKRWDSQGHEGVNHASYSTWLGRWLPGLTYLWAGPDIILQNYTPGVPYKIKTPETTYVHVSSEQHMNELKASSKDQLSLHAWANDMLRPDYTMGGLEVKDNGTANGTLHHRVLRVVLTSRIADLYAPLSGIVSSVLEKQMSSGDRDNKGWTVLPSWPMAKKIITTANSRVYFGPELMDNTEFQDSVHSFIDDLLFTAEVLRWTPSITHPLVSRLLLRNHRASKTIIKHLTPVVEERLRQARAGPSGSDSAKPVDCVQFFVDANSRKQEWTASRIVQVVLGMWFASVHQPVLTLIYALENLCEHPEYIAPLRRELSTLSFGSHISDDLEAASQESASTLENLPLLDAFMKESSRLRPSDAISVRRKVMQPFTFKDGIHIPAGDVLCVPMNAMMRDEALYPDAERFNAWRFLESTRQNERDGFRTTSRFTDTDFRYPLWGLGGHACPGKFYASFIMKLCLATVLKNHDIQLGLTSGPRRFYFRTATLPHWTSTLRFRRLGDNQQGEMGRTAHDHDP